MNLNSNDEVIAFLAASGYPTEYNDGLLAWLRDLYLSELTLPDLLHRYTSTYGNEIMVNAVVSRSGVREGYVSPAVTFTAVVASSADGGNKTTLTSAGTHGLTTASAVGASIAITAGTGWTPGLYEITAIDLDTTGVAITINTPFTSQGTPTIALANTEFTVKTIPLPPLAPNSYIRIDSTFAANNTTANSKLHRIKLAGTSFSNPTITTNPTNRTDIIIQNRNSTSNQVSAFTATSNLGFGAINTALVTTSVDTSVSVDLTFTVQIAVANEVVYLERYFVEVTI